MYFCKTLFLLKKKKQLSVVNKQYMQRTISSVLHFQLYWLFSTHLTDKETRAAKIHFTAFPLKSYLDFVTPVNEVVYNCRLFGTQREIQLNFQCSHVKFVNKIHLGILYDLLLFLFIYFFFSLFFTFFRMIFLKR